MSYQLIINISSNKILIIKINIMDSNILFKEMKIMIKFDLLSSNFLFLLICIFYQIFINFLILLLKYYAIVGVPHYI